jgi:hypothetical protein
MKKLIGIIASVGLAGAFLMPATSAGAAQNEPIGVTAILANYEVTKSLLRANVTVTGVYPGGSTIAPPGKVGLEFPVTAVKKGRAEHNGELFLSHTGAMGWRTVVVTNLKADLDKGTLTGRVYATDTDLGNYTIFKLTNVKNKAPNTSYTVKLAPGAASLLNSSLGVSVFRDGMRIGSGQTTFYAD